MLSSTGLKDTYVYSDKQVRKDGKTVSVRSKMPVHQAKQTYSLPSYTKYICSDAPTNLLRNNSAKYRYTIPKNSVHNLAHLSFQMTIKQTASASCRVVPAWNWFEKIEFRLNGGDILSTIYPQSNFMSLFSAVRESHLPYLARNVWFDDTPKSRYGVRRDVLPQDRIITVQLPITGAFFNTSDFIYANSQQDIIVEFTPASSIVAETLSGTPVIDLQSLAIMVENTDHPADEKRQRELEHKKSLHSALFLYPVEVIKTSQTLTAGTQYRFELDSVAGKVAFIQFAVKPTSTHLVNTNNGNQKYINIGDENTSPATIDLVDSANQSLFGDGTAINSKYLRQEIGAFHLQNDLLAQKPLYVIPLTSNVASAINLGTKQGCLQFNSGDKNAVVITPRAKVDEVQTITFSNANNTAGWCKFGLGGDYTPALAYNAGATAVQNAINALPFCKRRGITVSATAGDLEGTYALTFTCPEGNMEGELVDVISNLQDGSGVIDRPTVALSTVGQDGISSGSQYDIHAYCYVYHEISQYDGRVSVRRV